MFLLLLLSVTCTTAVEYWVRPDNMLSCPSSIPPHAQCVTITDLVTDSTNTSFNNGVSVTVVFLPGTHVPKKSGFIVVGNLYTNQGIKAIYKSTSGLKDVRIDCESSHPISLVFFRILYLTFKNIELQNCGLNVWFNKPFKHYEYLNGTTFSLAISNIPKVQILNVSIVKSKGAGMIVITNCNQTNAIILNRIMIIGNGKNKNGMFGNLYIREFTNLQKDNPFSKINKMTKVIINNSTISNGCDLLSGFSGGLSLVIFEQKYIYITINNCNFINNTAHKGGGTGLFTGTSINTNVHIQISRSLFLNNKAISGGGLSSYTPGCFLKIFETEFRENTADEYGGAIDTSTDVGYKYYKCRFISNIAKDGAAIYSENSFPTKIINCTFTHNICKRDHLGIFVPNTIELYFQEGDGTLSFHNVTITDNECGGLYLYNAGLKLAGTNIIQRNYALNSDGGGILFECDSQHTTTGDISVDPRSNTILSIINNTADGYGGGIAIRGDCGLLEDTNCFFKVKPTDTTKIIFMEHNRGKKGGNGIFGSLKSCWLWDIFDIANTSDISSPPEKVRICSDDLRTYINSPSVKLVTYPGQKFHIPLICTGQSIIGPSYCKVQAQLEVTSKARINEETQLQEIGLECKKLYYSIETQQTNYTEHKYSQRKRFLLYLRSIFASSSNSSYNKRLSTWLHTRQDC